MAASKQQPTPSSSSPRPIQRARQSNANTKFALSTTAPKTSTLRQTLNSALLKSGGIHKLQKHLLQGLNETGWTDNVRARCLELFRKGLSREEVFKQVRKEIRSVRKKRGMGDDGGKLAEAKALSVPDKVLDEGRGVLRDCLGEVVQVWS